MGKKVSFYEYIMATRLNDPFPNYHTEFAQAIYGMFPDKQLEDEFDGPSWWLISHEIPELQKYNMAAHDLWQEYKRLSPDATLQQIMVPYYSA